MAYTFKIISDVRKISDTIEERVILDDNGSYCKQIRFLDNNMDNGWRTCFISGVYPFHQKAANRQS